MPASWRGVVRPLICWASASVLLLGWQYHAIESSRATVTFSVSMEGRKETTPVSAWLNEQPYQSERPSGVGWKKLVLTADGFERFETNCLVGYGGKDFGNITLARSHGQLELTCEPKATQVSITGNEGVRQLTNVTCQTLTLPTGRYTVEARFTRFTVGETVEVGLNQTAQARFKPLMTAVQVSAEPEGAEFELTSDKSPRVTVSGTTPALLTDLPTGGYKLAISRGDYRKELQVSLDATRATNELIVPFRYAKLSITSNPDGVNIEAGKRKSGRTPATLELPPGTHHLVFTKEGHLPTNLVVTLTETDAKTVAVELVNQRFAEAMENARRKSASGIDPDRALVDIDEALLIRPGDETALALQRDIRFDQHMRKAWLLERQSGYTEALAEVKAALKLKPNDAKAVTLRSDWEKAQRAVEEVQARVKQEAEEAEARARRNRPVRWLQELSRPIKHNELFEPQRLRFNGSATDAKTRIIRALRQSPAWNIEQSDALKDGGHFIQAEASGKGWMQTAVIVLAPMAENETAIHFKLCAFVVGEGAESGLFKPLHPKFVTTIDPRVAEDYLDKDTKKFRSRLEQELQ